MFVILDERNVGNVTQQDARMKNPIELRSLLETHDRPFLVMNRDYRIVGVNHAFEKAYRLNDADVVGKPCYQVSHGNDKPCHEYGEECPHWHVYHTHESHTCLHIHHDSDARVHQVRVTMYPLDGPDGELLAGEIFDELAVLDAAGADQVCMVGAAPVFLHALEQLRSAAKYDAPVLLLGETGTGKELAANFIHDHSSRREKPLLTMDCTVLTEALFESEVFGHERGAFTGNVGKKLGLFELASGGTLFLDEVSEMAPSTQAKMLRVLETGQFRRLGGSDVIRADARIICATNRDLKQADWFREDLFYRVACLTVRIPSLRERLEDIPLLVSALFERISHSTGITYRLTPAALKLLQEYHYPGNIRELRNILWAAVTHATDHHIDIEHLQQCDPFHSTATIHNPIDNDMPITVPTLAATTPSVHHSLDDIEAGYITQLLEECAGNRRRAAEQLGVSERTLYRKLKRFNLS
ncbi:MAG TPA: sigma 54-interacting transcriptional regulator [Gammaproteobacteria bacterium]|jgi:transcriptional regulator with PAS, ATPase and Fis domain|nr:sigma 54-interacting transcriptional regulator [Gammaproteobacteria bacterium]